MAVKLETTIQRYLGLSTDTKPTSVKVGSLFFETDTRIWYKCSDGTTWVILDTSSGEAIGLIGTCSSTMVDSTTTIVVPDLAGFGNDYFNNKFYMQIILNASVHGNVPEKQVRKITDYVSATGTFTTDAYTSNVSALDKVMVLHESTVILI